VVHGRAADRRRGSLRPVPPWPWRRLIRFYSRPFAVVFFVLVICLDEADEVKSVKKEGYPAKSRFLRCLPLSARKRYRKTYGSSGNRNFASGGLPTLSDLLTEPFCRPATRLEERGISSWRLLQRSRKRYSSLFTLPAGCFDLGGEPPSLTFRTKSYLESVSRSFPLE
jgi:hypothetical protein